MGARVSSVTRVSDDRMEEKVQGSEEDRDRGGVGWTDRAEPWVEEKGLPGT